MLHRDIVWGPAPFDKCHADQGSKDNQRSGNGVDRWCFSKDKKADQGGWNDVEIEHWRQKTGISPAKGTDKEELRHCRQKAGHDHHE